MNATDLILLREVEQLTQTHGVCTLSTRQLAELTGITRKTIVCALSRLASTGHIIQTKKGRGGHPSHWKATSQNHYRTAARMTPRSDQGTGTGTADAFRRRDLRGPGALYRDLPDVGYFTVEEALSYTGLTARERTIEWWLIVLGSQLWPMVDEVVSEDGRPVLWAKNGIQDWQLQQNADYLNGVAAVTGARALKTRQMMTLQHQIERAGVARMFPFSRTVAA